MNIPDIKHKLKQLKDEKDILAIDEFLELEFDIKDIVNQNDNRIYSLNDSDIIIVLQTSFFSEDILFIVTRIKY